MELLASPMVQGGEVVLRVELLTSPRSGRDALGPEFPRVVTRLWRFVCDNYRQLPFPTAYGPIREIFSDAFPRRVTVRFG